MDFNTMWEIAADLWMLGPRAQEDLFYYHDDASTWTFGEVLAMCLVFYHYDSGLRPIGDPV